MGKIHFQKKIIRNPRKQVTRCRETPKKNASGLKNVCPCHKIEKIEGGTFDEKRF